MNSQHSYKHFIRNRYGDDTYQNILKHQKVAKSFEMVRRDIRFLARCKKEKVIPIHCRIRGRRSASPTTRKIIETAESKLLSRSVSKSYSKQTHLKNQMRDIGNQLRESLSTDDLNKFGELSKKKIEGACNQKEKRIDKKLQKLKVDQKSKTNKKQETPSAEEIKQHEEKTILNFTDNEIPVDFVNILSKGLDYKTSTENVPKLDIITGVERMAKNFAIDQANYMRYQVLTILEKPKQKGKINIAEKDCQKVRNWLKQNNLVLIESDKGRATCIIGESKVKAMMHTELSKTERYTPVNSDPTKICQAEVNKLLKELHVSNLITADELKKLEPKTPSIPSARPTLKAHKVPLKIRLIINTQGSASYKIAKLVSRELKPLVLGGKSYTKDSANFVQTIKSIKLEPAENIVSFDVEDMYPSLPRAEVLKEVSRLIKLPHFRPKINKRALIKLCEICLSQMYFRVEDRYFEQKDGLFIGAPSSPPFGELYLQKLEREYIFSKPEPPKLWLRKVDDTFVVTKKDPQIMLSELNNIHPQVNFTFEPMVNNQMPFLDCLVIREGNNLEVKVYKKPTHTGQYIHYTSNVAPNIKASVISTLTRRAKLVCTKNDYLAEELQYIKKTMMLNGYPKSFIEKEIKKTLKKMENTPNNSNKEKTEGIAKLFLPYERGYGEKIKRIAKKHGIEVIFTRGQTLKQKLSTPRGKKLEKQGVVYSVRCKSKRCKMEYIGETGRQLKIRMKEHETDSKVDFRKKSGKKKKDKLSGLSEHLKKKKHQLDWSSIKILAKENNYWKRRSKEAYFITKHKDKAPLLNKKNECPTISNIWKPIL